LHFDEARICLAGVQLEFSGKDCLGHVKLEEFDGFVIFENELKASHFLNFHSSGPEWDGIFCGFGLCEARRYTDAFLHHERLVIEELEFDYPCRAVVRFC
jgi:hypothetical protein